MIAHVILDPFRPHPNETIERELDEQNINAKIWIAVHDSTSVVRSINLSHKRIVAFAKDHKLPEICILEEDVMFLAPNAWDYFMSHKPDFYDLYLGGCYGLNQDAYRRIAEQPGAVKINNFAGLHCYCISERYYDRFLAMSEDKHIDDQPGLGIFYVCSPFVALQHPGWSSNNKEYVNYHRNFRRDIPNKCLISWEKIKENP